MPSGSENDSDYDNDNGAGVMNYKRNLQNSNKILTNRGGSESEESGPEDEEEEEENNGGEDKEDEEQEEQEEEEEEECDMSAAEWIKAPNEVLSGNSSAKAEDDNDDENSTDDERGLGPVAPPDTSKAQPLSKRQTPPVKAPVAKKKTVLTLAPTQAPAPAPKVQRQTTLLPKAVLLQKKNASRPAAAAAAPNGGETTPDDETRQQQGQPQQAIIDSEPDLSDAEEPHRTVGVQRPTVAPERFDAVAEAEIARKQCGHAPAAAQPAPTEGNVDSAIADNVTFVLLSVGNTSAGIVPKEDLVHAVAVDDDQNQLLPYEMVYSAKEEGLRATATSKAELARKLLQKHPTRMLRSVILSKVVPPKEATGKHQIHMQAFVPVVLVDGEIEKSSDCKFTFEQLAKNAPEGYQLVLAIEPKIVAEMYKITKHGLPTKYAPSDNVRYWTVKNANDQAKIDPKWILCAKTRTGSRSSSSGGGASSAKRKAAGASGTAANTSNTAAEDDAAVAQAEADPEVEANGVAEAPEAPPPAPAAKRSKGPSGARQRAGQPMLTEMGVTNSMPPAAAFGVGATGDLASPPPPPPPPPAGRRATVGGQLVLDLENFAQLHDSAPNFRGALIGLSEPSSVQLMQLDPQHIYLTVAPVPPRA